MFRAVIANDTQRTLNRGKIKEEKEEKVGVTGGMVGVCREMTHTYTSSIILFSLSDGVLLYSTIRSMQKFLCRPASQSAPPVPAESTRLEKSY